MLNLPILYRSLVFALALFPLSWAAYAQNQVVVNGAGTVGSNGIYTEAGTSNSRPYFDLPGGQYRIEYRDGCCGLEWEIWDINASIILYYHLDPGQTPVLTSWVIDNGTSPAPSVTNNVLFTDGSAYLPPVLAPSTSNNPVGQFFLDSGATGSNLTALTVALGGSSPSGITAVKLWSSTDAAFDAGSDVQLSSQAAEATVSFSGLTSAIDQTGTYFFVTVDLNESPSGTLMVEVSSQSSATMTLASMQNTFTDAPLSGSDALLPVELTSFTATADGPDVLLRWETASETNNAGFEVQHRADDTWHLLSWVDGHGTTETEQTYSFQIDDLQVGRHTFRLKQIDYDGTFDYSPEIEVATGLAEVYRMTLPYPSPLKDGAAQFSLSVARQQHVAVVVYDMLGRRRTTLFEGEMAASTTQALQLNRSSLPSGMYMIRAEGEHFIATRPLTVVK
jgi:hypothetical protein